MSKLNIMPEKMRAMILSKLGPVESNPLKLTEIDRHEIANPKEILVKIGHVEYVIHSFIR